MSYKRYITKHSNKLLPRRLCTLAVTLLTSLSSPCYAIYFDNLSIEDGLSQSTINRIVQDQYGFIWIATAEGLNRYDGTKFLHFSASDNNSDLQASLSSSNIWYIDLDNDGNLWISTQNGLNFLNTSTYKVKQYLHDPSNPNSITSNNTRSLTIDNNGYVWLRTVNGIDRLDPKTEKFKHYPYSTENSKYSCSNTAQSMLVDNNQDIWIGSTTGLCRFNQQTEIIEFIDYRNNIYDSATNSISDIIQDNANNLWITSSNGVFKYNYKTKQSIAYFHDNKNANSLIDNQTNNISELNSNQLLIVTQNGLSILNKKTNTFTNFQHQNNTKNSLSGNIVRTVFVDQSGLIWLGIGGQGINTFNPRQRIFKHISYNTNKPGYTLSDPSVWEILNAYEYLWVGTNNGLNRINTETGKIKHYFKNTKTKNSLPHNSIYDMAAGAERDLWIATWKGLSHYFVDEEKFENYQHDPQDPHSIPSNRILTVYYDKSKNQVWAGFDDKGIAMLDVKSQRFTHYQHNAGDLSSISDNYIANIIKLNSNHMLISTGNGIDRFNLSTKKFEHISKKHNPIAGINFDIKISNTGNLLVASDYGLGITDPNTLKLIRLYNTDSGLENHDVYSVEEDRHGNIWVSTNRGISQINTTSNKAKNYNVFDGLQGYEFNGDASFYNGKYLYFGGYNGINYFKPEEIKTNDFIPPIAITSFSVHGIPSNTTLVTEAIELNYRNNYFAIEFAALDFTHPQKNQYAYKLEGFDQDWIYSNNRNFASYTNIEGGEYTFRVKAANKYGIWNEPGISLAITITPPFWKTLWFRLLSFIATILIIFSIYTLRVRSIKTRNKKLKEEVNARTADLKERTEELEKTLLELGETKDALIEAAHKAGMADTATAVLHNVGNLLNSVTTSAGLIHDSIATSVSEKFLKIHTLLENNKNNLIEYLEKDPKGQRIPSFLLALGPSFEKESGQLNENAINLTQKIESIKESISAQQRFVQQGGGFVEQLSLIDIVEESLLLQTGSIGRHKIKIVRHYDDKIPLINVQKTKLIQILINLYKNAKESMDACSSTKNILTIKVYADQNFAYIRYTDTGLGIEKEKLEKVFAHGYTTKECGHGFGLHSCANYMTEMHGKIWAESESRNKGATFVLQFPLIIAKNQTKDTASAQ